MAEITIRQDGHQVLLVIDGRAHVLPHSVATMVGRALIEKGRAAEEIANAARIAADQALLIRIGAPIGLTSHPKIQAEAKKLAEHDRTLRRAIPSSTPALRGIESRGIVGSPQVIRGDAPGSDPCRR